MTLVASAVVPTGTLAESSAPLVKVGELGPLAVSPDVFAAITLFALANGALINMIMASRIVYGMSEEGIVPSAFGRVLKGRRTPITAIVFTTVLGLILVSTGDLGDLADTTVLLLLVAFTMVNVSVLVLRREQVDHDHFRAPTIAPILAAIASVVLIIDNDGETFAPGGTAAPARRDPLDRRLRERAPGRSVMTTRSGPVIADRRSQQAELLAVERRPGRSDPPGPRPSSSSNFRFRSSPPPNPTSEPSAPITRWHGTTTGTGFRPSAAPTTRARLNCSSPSG